MSASKERLAIVLELIHQRMMLIENNQSQLDMSLMQLREGVHYVRNAIGPVLAEIGILQKDQNADDESIRELQKKLGLFIDQVRDFHTETADRYSYLDNKIKMIEQGIRASTRDD